MWIKRSNLKDQKNIKGLQDSFRRPNICQEFEMEQRERTNPGSNKIKIPGPRKDMSSIGTGPEMLRNNSESRQLLKVFLMFSDKEKM